MITESFINSCFTLCFNKYSMIKKTKKLYIELLLIINTYETLNKNNVPNDVVNKMSLLKGLLESMINGRTSQDAIDRTNFDGVYKGLDDFLGGQIERPISMEEMNNVNERISQSRETILLMTGMKKLNKMIEKYNTNNFKTHDEIITECFTSIENFNNEIMNCKRTNLLNTGGSFMLGLNDNDVNDTNIDPVLNMLEEINNPLRKIPTGFKVLDFEVLNGGFAKKALYIFAGAAKSGKSTLINNMMIQAAQVDYSDRPESDGKVKVFIHISLENLPYESLVRTYCKISNCTPSEILNRSRDNRNLLKNEINRAVSNYKNVVHFDYKESGSVSVFELYPYIDSILEDASDKLGKECVLAAIYIDYLNHLKEDGTKDLRLKLGDVAQKLKTLAIDYDVPVITATQLNREALRVKSSHELNIGMVGESHLLSCHADGIFLLARDSVDLNLVHFNSGVQRGDKSLVALDFDVDFEKLNFKSCKKADFIEKVNIETGNMDIPKGTEIIIKETVRKTNKANINFGGMGDSF